MNTMYNRIYKMACENGMSLYELCQKAGVNRARLSDLKSGRIKTLNFEIIRKLATALNVTTDALVFGDEEKRVIHLDLDSDKVNFREFCERLELDELLTLLNAAANEIKRRNNTAATSSLFEGKE